MAVKDGGGVSTQHRETFIASVVVFFLELKREKQNQKNNNNNNENFTPENVISIYSKNK